MKIKVKILTPVHISSGEELSPAEYFIEKNTGKFNRIDLESLFADRAFDQYRENYIREASLSRYLGSIIMDQSLLLKHSLYSLPASPEFKNQNFINVKLFIKSAGRVFIPGSSLKGSIISALLYYALGKLYSKSNESFNLKTSYEDLLNKAYGYLSIDDDKKENQQHQQKNRFLNLISISDSNLLSPDKCLRVDIAKVIGAKRGGQIPISYETLREGTVFELELKSKNCRLNEKEILNICHNFYSKVAEKEQLFQLSRDPYLCRLGQGSSRWAVSFLVLAQELGIKDYLRPPRTRKRIIYGQEKAMGFIQLLIS